VSDWAIYLTSFFLRTPLNTVTLGLRLLEQHLENLRTHLAPSPEAMIAYEDTLQDCAELIFEINENTSLAVTTLNDLINYDKIESKTFTIEREPVKILAVLQKTVGLLELHAKEKGVQMKMDPVIKDQIHFSGLMVSGDSLKLAQVYRNLISNALKFSPTGSEVLISGLSATFLC
jgi:signal transduction histidine kinase